MCSYKPGSEMAQRHGCTCTLSAQTTVHDDAVEEALGHSVHYPTFIPEWDPVGCPLHDVQTQRKNRKRRMHMEGFCPICNWRKFEPVSYKARAMYNSVRDLLNVQHHDEQPECEGIVDVNLHVPLP